jgi:hypothetical protein
MKTLEKRSGLIAGISLIIMAITAGFSFGYAQPQLLNDSANITANIIINNKSLFIMMLAGWVIIFATDLIVSWTLYVYFKTTNLRVSQITAIVRVVYTLLLGLGIVQLISILPILSNPESAIDIQNKFNAFQQIWSAGLIIFGFHLLGLGYLSVKSYNIPSLFGYLLYIAGAGYIFIHLSKQTGYISQSVIDSTEIVLALPMALAEILLAFWLIYKGAKRN